MKKTKDYLICLDSDGTVMDTMELKHKECFCPATVYCWDLQCVSRYARETAEFVNLYSRWRGINRFPALVETLELLFQRPEVIASGISCPELAPLKQWIGETNSMSTAALRAYCADRKVDPVLSRALAWSEEVDANVRHMVRNIRPFGQVKEILQKLSNFADIVIVSTAPKATLLQDFQAYGIADMVSDICGQEAGSKTDIIHCLCSMGYASDHVIKIGDARSDYEAAKKNDILFYPILAGKECDSWTDFENLWLERFLSGRYRQYQENLERVFLENLGEVPPWLR